MCLILPSFSSLLLCLTKQGKMMEVMFEKPTLDNAPARGNSSGKYKCLESQIKVACVAKEKFIVARV